ncbi:MAG: AAA family ATPase [Candidatus Hodarchaeales archaeon]|jgi:adenylate kinase
MKIYVTGTPGTGKTTLSLSIKTEFPDMHLFEINNLLEQLRLFEEYDQERKVSVYDPFKVYLPLEKFLKDYEHFIIVGAPIPFQIFTWDCLIVLSCTKGDILKQRLVKRGYSEKKILENLEAEFVGEILGSTMDWLSIYGPIITLDSCVLSIKELTREAITFLRKK